jgi:hypothetical protein
MKWCLRSLILCAALLLTACSSSPSASPSPSPSASPTGNGTDAYIQCLHAHGVTSHATQATVKKAAEACASLAPSASVVSAQLQKYMKCLSSHGVSLPTGTSGNNSTAVQQAVSQMRGTKALAAIAACATDVPTP